MINPTHYMRIPIEEAIKIPDDGIFMIYKNRYWAVKDGNILFYRRYTSPQCNSDKRIMDRMVNEHRNEILFLERVFVPHECDREY